MNKFIYQLVITASLILVGTCNAFADIAVIVHPSNDASLTQKDIKRIFLKKSKKFPNGVAAIPVNQPTDMDITDEFNELVLKKSSQRLKGYWSKLVFTGKGKPPQEAGDDTAVKTLIANDPSMIGYIDNSTVDASVKVIATF